MKSSRSKKTIKPVLVAVKSMITKPPKGSKGKMKTLVSPS